MIWVNRICLQGSKWTDPLPCGRLLTRRTLLRKRLARARHHQMQMQASKIRRHSREGGKRGKGPGLVGHAIDVRSTLFIRVDARAMSFTKSHRKKTRCSGKCPCSLCQKAGQLCQFTASYTRGRLPSIIIDDSAMDKGPQHVSRSSISETSPGLDTASSMAQYPRIYPATSVVRRDAPIHDDLSESGDDATRASSPRNTPEPQRGQTDQQGHYVGNSSAVSFLIRIQKRLHQNSSLSHDSTIFTFGDAPLQEFENSFFLPPSKTDAQKLVEHYFDFAAPTHRFLHRPSIEKLVEEFYKTGGEMSGREDGKAKSALLMVLFAQAQAYMPKGRTLKDNRYAMSNFSMVFTDDRQCPILSQIRTRTL
jgi:hypothetical protein